MCVEEMNYRKDIRIHSRRNYRSKVLSRRQLAVYDGQDVVKMPLLVDEVRGKERLERFSEMLITPYVPPAGGVVDDLRGLWLKA